MAHALKSLQLPEEFWQSVFKSPVKEVVVGVTGYLIKWCTILWLMMREQGMVTGVNFVYP